MTHIQRIVTAALAAIAAAIIPLWTPAQETWGQENTPPVISEPTSTSLHYLFPRGEKAVLDFSSEPVTDMDVDQNSDPAEVWFVFTVPDISTPGNDTDTTDPAEALFKVTRDDHDFEFTAKDGFTPEDFTALYGNVVSHNVPVKMYAHDGTDNSDPLSFTITAHHDASPQFHHSATYSQSKQRWELDTDTVIEVYEGPQANRELGKIILGTGGQPARISGITDALQVPWKSTKGGTRTWTLGNRDGTVDSPRIKCNDQSGTATHIWDEAGSEDSAQFTITPQGDRQKGHIPIRFASTPDYEDAQDEGTDNEYLIRLVSDHDIHGFGGESPTLGCDGSALDLKIRIKDVGPPAPPRGVTLSLQANTQDRFGIYWTTPHANQFIENETPVDFPNSSFNITSLVIRHKPDGLRFRKIPIDGPMYFPTNIEGIQGIQGTPGVIYTITARLRNSEGESDPVLAHIRLPGPPAIPEAPTVIPESDTSIRATWKEPDNDGGQPITGYKVQYQEEDAGDGEWTELPNTKTGTSAIITGLDMTSTYNVQVKAQNDLGTSEWSPTGTGSTAGMVVVQITSGEDVVSGNDAVFTVTLSKAATITVNLTHSWTGEYGESTSGALEFTGEISKKYELPTVRGTPGSSSGSVTVTIDTDTDYEIGTDGSATVNITQNPNSQPILEAPSNLEEGALYKFPAGKTDGIRYDSEPGKDPDGETLTYIITFTNPKAYREGTNREETVTIPAVGSAAEVLQGTLLTIKRFKNSFIFEPDGNVTPDQFEATYDRVTLHSEEKTLEVQLWASDGTERSPPVDFTLRLHYDPSGYFPEPAENRSISRWELPGAIEINEGTSTLSGTTVEWTSPLSGTHNWATGNPTTPVFCRHGPAGQDGQEDQDDQDWPDAGNEDSNLFTLDTSTTTGDSGSITLSFKAPPDFESPSDSDKDNIYKLRLHNIHSLHQATGDKGKFPTCSGSAIDVTVKVINVNEPPVFPAESDDRSVTENTEAGQPIGDPVEAKDMDPDEALTYTLDGTDATSFDITESTGQLQTKAALDYETKSGYTVTVTASDGALTAAVDVTVTVTNVDEAGTVTLSTNQPPARAEITAALTDPDEGVSGAVWQWERSSDGNTAWAGIGTSSPSYTPVDGDVGYHLRATASYADGHGPGKTAQAASTQAVQAGANRSPEFDSATATREVPENTEADENIGSPVAATDPDTGDTPTYTLEGADLDSFGIDSASGQIQTKSGVTYDHETKSSYSVTVKADDNNGGTATIDVTITVADVNEPPEFSMETASRTITENTTTGVNIGTPVTATDPDAGETLTYGLAGTDATSFSIVTTSGQLQTKADLDFEEKASYTVTVTATDPGNLSNIIEVTIAVTNVNEPPQFPSEETGTRRVDENTAADQNIGSPVSATDPDTGDTLTYSLGGTDAASFGIVTTSGQLQTKTNLDFEEKTSYTLTVSVRDSKDASGNADTTTDDAITVTITVTNVDETPTVTGDSTINYAENGTGTIAAYTAVDPEGGQITWSLSGDDSGQFSITGGALTFNTPPDYEAPASADQDNEYLVTVRASDGDNVVTLAATVTVTDENEPPAFTEETDARTIAENTAAGQNIGAPFLATDTDAGETLTYGLAGTDAASFGITPSTGQLQTKNDLDFEEKASYTVTVSVRDSRDDSGNTDTTTDATITITITVTDENETPSVSGQTNVGYEENRTDTVATYTASDPEGTSVTWSLSGNDAQDFAINEGVLTFRSTPNFEDAADANTDNVYLATVEASDGSVKGTLNVTVTVTGVSEAPEFPATETGTRAIAENTEAGQPIGNPVEAMDPDVGDSLTYTLSGTNAGSFDIVTTTGNCRPKPT